jgi:oligoendopeptidase F
MAPTPLTLAETASVFGEMLTFKRLLAETRRRQAAQGAARRQGRGHDQHRGAADRVLFVRARQVHTERKNGELTAERIGEIWLSVQGESLGPAIDSARATRISGCTSRTSSIRRSTSTPMRSAIAW